jgi:hypothetical protein
MSVNILNRALRQACTRRMTIHASRKCLLGREGAVVEVKGGLTFLSGARIRSSIGGQEPATHDV